ncbi:MAG TPA: hypothetical protein VGP79_02375 [Bryobacteraceae bacterium]|nr:hypothetical protein [Bryobacteraceae bacterium]
MQAAGPEGTGSSAGAPAASAPTLPPADIAFPQGTALRVRLAQSVDTERNRPGDRFQATLDVPLVSGNRVIVPRGTPFYGQVIQAKPSGRFKGRAVLALRLDSFQLNGESYSIRSAAPTRVSNGHKKHDTVWIGGGAAGGAGIGALAGGPMGALIGAGAGAGAGLTGGLITGKKHVRLPVESRLTFTLSSEIRVRG